MADTKICLTIRNRLAYTKKTIQSLRENTPREEYELYIFGNMSDRELEEQWTYLRRLYQRKHVDGIVINTETSTMGRWSKSWAINQCIRLCELQDNASRHWEWLVIIDNDMVIRKPWLDTAKKVYMEAKSKYPSVMVCSPWDDPNPEHPVVAKENYAGVPVKIKRGNGAGCWLVHREFLTKIGLAKIDGFRRGSTDWDYQARMADVMGSADNFVTFDDKGETMDTFGYSFSERVYAAKHITGQDPKGYWDAFSRYLDDFSELKKYIDNDPRFEGWSYLRDKEW